MRLARAVSILLLVAMASVARADDLEVELRNMVARKDGLPALIVRAHAAIADVVVELNGGGKSLHFESGPLRAGSTHRFTFDPGDAPVLYTGSLTVKYPPRTGKPDASMDLHFSAQAGRPPAIQVSPGDLDLKKGELFLSSDHVLGTVEVSIFGEDGQLIAAGRAEAKGAQPGTRFPVHWMPSSQRALKVHVKATDVDGFYSGLDLFPWRVDVPHQDVVFPSGSATIPATERSKLDTALGQLLPQLRRSRRFADVRLFVVGHTDTVGSDATNQALSEARARSIAAYFRAHGVSAPIAYAGMGETALAVQTPDETDEPRNRRAEYVLSVVEPEIAHAKQPPHWKRL